MPFPPFSITLPNKGSLLALKYTLSVSHRNVICHEGLCQPKEDCRKKVEKIFHTQKSSPEATLEKKKKKSNLLLQWN